ncbi:MAG: beta-glucosidase [Anaerolineales bacterium]|nr:beta-glucosidase [Anaerolineales bacterium]
MPFPKTFLWGAATSSYQIEGAADLRGECVWDRFCHTWPSKVVHQHTGDVACDHYHRYREDVTLMQQLSLQAYRFSIAWARVLPQGTGAVNADGLAFYDRLVDELLAANIQPYATLYHWDLPQALQNQGGWSNPDSVGWFAEYADIVARKLGDRVKGWMTHNEPWIVAFVGHYYGGHPPGVADLTTTYEVAHHLLLAHGAAVPIIRQNTPTNTPVGIALNLNPAYPATPSAEDVAAAQRQDGFLNRWFLDPLFKGHYPADIMDLVADHFPKLDVSAVQAAAVPIDFLGVNYYLRNVIAASDDRPLQLRHIMPDDARKTALDWEIYPDGLHELLTRLQRDYDPKAIYITENGAAFDDPAPVNGVVDDPLRIGYFKEHFAAIERALADGAKVAGYFAWSLLDNFEWSHGYDKRFGLIHMDYQTLQRTPKQSAWFYRDLILASQ